jgi:hypothetical protein
MNMLIRFGDDAFAIELMILGWALGYKLFGLVGWGVEGGTRLSLLPMFVA